MTSPVSIQGPCRLCVAINQEQGVMRGRKQAPAKATSLYALKVSSATMEHGAKMRPITLLLSLTHCPSALRARPCMQLDFKDQGRLGTRGTFLLSRHFQV